MNVSVCYFSTPYGELILGSTGDRLCLCDWRYRKMRQAVDSRILKSLNAVFVEEETAVTCAAIAQLNEYFTGDRHEFDLSLHTAGTSFQQKVWDYLRTIPYGETRTYLDIAKALGDKNSVRAVAAANGANGIAVIIPCHRVIGSDGTMMGYAGGLATKRKLLELEQPQLKLF